MEEKWDKKKNGTYLTFHNTARLAGIILVFGKKVKPRFSQLVYHHHLYTHAELQHPQSTTEAPAKTPLHSSSVSPDNR